MNTDVELMTAAIRARLKNEDERRSLEVRELDHGERLEVRLYGQTTLVRPTALEHTRKSGEWDITAQGCLSRLRNRHSMDAPMSYTLEDVYREINQVLLKTFRSALSDREYSAFMADILSADLLAIRDQAAQLKAMNEKIAERIMTILSPPKAPHTLAAPSSLPWTSDLIRK